MGVLLATSYETTSYELTNTATGTDTGYRHHFQPRAPTSHLQLPTTGLRLGSRYRL